MDEFEHHKGTTARVRLALEDLERQWRRLDAPIASHLRPGIEPTAVDSLAERHGLKVPLELKVLWNWHDGADGGERPWVEQVIGPGRYQFLSAAESLEAYADNRRIHPEPPDVGSDIYWHRSWLPFMRCDAYRLYVDCDRTTWNVDGCTPVRLVRWDWESYDADCAQDLTQAVQQWAWVLKEGYVTYSEGGGWVDRDDLPAWLVRTGLV